MDEVVAPTERAEGELPVVKDLDIGADHDFSFPFGQTIAELGILVGSQTRIEFSILDELAAGDYQAGTAHGHGPVILPEPIEIIKPAMLVAGEDI